MSVLNTRRALRWVGVLMILSLLLSACAPAAAPASAPAAGGDAAAAPGDELTRDNTLILRRRHDRHHHARPGRRL
jgi:hypothetical protein